MTVDWQSLFALNVPLLEIVVRGTAIYWFLFVLFRLLVRRELGAVGMADLLVLVIIADAAQNAMAGEYTTITEGMVLIATVMGWNVFIDGLVYRFPFARRLLQQRALCLVHNGRIQQHNLRKEFLSEDELRAKLREKGIRDPSEVERAYLEADGELSVLKRRARATSQA